MKDLIYSGEFKGRGFSYIFFIAVWILFRESMQK